MEPVLSGSLRMCFSPNVTTENTNIKDMIQTVVKRDGRIVGFNREKIAAAIRKAMLTTEHGEDEVLVNKIVDRIEYRGGEKVSVEDIQDMVEMELMKSPRKEVAKSYIAYRNRRSIARKAKTREMFLEIVEAW